MRNYQQQKKVLNQFENQHAAIEVAQFLNPNNMEL